MDSNTPVAICFSYVNVCIFDYDICRLILAFGPLQSYDGATLNKAITPP